MPLPGADTCADASAGGTGAGAAGQSGACPAHPANCAGQSGARPVDLATAEGHKPFIVQGSLSAREYYKRGWRGAGLNALRSEGDDTDYSNLCAGCARCAGSATCAEAGVGGASAGTDATDQGASAPPARPSALQHRGKPRIGRPRRGACLSVYVCIL